MLALPPRVRLLLAGQTVYSLDLEAYVAGVVSQEMTGPVPPEALRAQAVAARSYAAAAVRYPRHPSADLCATTHCQAWGWQVSEWAQAAVGATRGEVIVWGGQVATAFYHGNCGGMTRSPMEVWQVAAPWCASVACPVEGGAYDHGVGLCQRGAVAMAESGVGYRAILEHYYTGIELVRA